VSRRQRGDILRAVRAIRSARRAVRAIRPARRAVRAIRPVLLAALAWALVGAPALRAAASPPEPRREGAADRPPLDVYLGQEPREVHSRARIEGAHSRQVLEPVLQGDVVRHDVLVPNDGSETLELRDVRACPGCIVVSWPRRIAPGSEGRISLVFVTDAYGGQEMGGTLTARTDDPQRPELRVEVLLFVEEFADVSPYRVWLRGSVGEEIVARSVITPSARHPFAVTGVRARKGVWFEHELRTIEVDGRRAYEIVVRNTREKPGPYQDVLFVQTDDPARPELKVRIEGRIDPR
jgi:hypothetical protein